VGLPPLDDDDDDDAGSGPRATRRGLLAGAAALGAAIPLAGADVADAARRRRRRRPRRPPPRPLPPLGSGGEPTPPARLAEIAREIGEGQDVLFADLAALDGNLEVVESFTRTQGWAVRPALKSFDSPGLAGYLLGRMPQSRGLLFHLRVVDELLAGAPEGTDLLQAYPPALPELARYLSTPAPSQSRGHRVRLLIDSLELLRELVRLAPAARRPLPLDVVLQLEAGLELSGLRSPEELSAALALLREHAGVLRFSGWLAYDGHGSFRPDREYRKQVADDARRRQAAWNAQLRAEAPDLIAARDFVRNGPGSSTYRQHEGNGEINEVSPGVALVPHGYITQDGFDNDGLRPVLHNAACVHRVAEPRVPLLSTPDPRAEGRQNVSCKGGGPGPGTPVHPKGLEGDDLSGNNGGLNQAHYYAPRGSLARGDYIVLRVKDASSAINTHAAIVAVRDGTVRRIWPTQARSGALRTQLR